ncbi:Hypothetical predicted protein [Xyrichtys novacula]|uniref:Uncharacterized protein n=1 Tax=Xyrichtys novacula TaxID=13765 RepID=A0AAV1EI92_XYRNO|nr:Hypothetical predicted protein [Xyrichtys novacula]
MSGDGPGSLRAMCSKEGAGGSERVDVVGEGVEVDSETSFLVEAFKLVFFSFHLPELGGVPGGRAMEGDRWMGHGSEGTSSSHCKKLPERPVEWRRTASFRSPSRSLERLVVVAADWRVSEGWAQCSPMGGVREESPSLARGSVRGPLHVGGEVVFMPMSNGDREAAGPEGAGPDLAVVRGAAAGRPGRSGEPWSGIRAARRLEEKGHVIPRRRLAQNASGDSVAVILLRRANGWIHNNNLAPGPASTRC